MWPVNTPIWKASKNLDCVPVRSQELSSHTQRPKKQHDRLSLLSLVGTFTPPLSFNDLDQCVLVANFKKHPRPLLLPKDEPGLGNVR